MQYNNLSTGLDEEGRSLSALHANGTLPYVKTGGSPSSSSPYTTVSVQGTYRLTTLELYAGFENIGNYRQPNPIISAGNPFGPHFDLSSIWGPTRGREFYLGVRYSIK